MEPLDIQAIKTELMDYLRDHAGEQMTAYTIAKRLGQPGPSTRHFLIELAENGLIRRSGSRTSVAFYIPTQAQVDAESRVQEDRFRPLRARPQMAERIAQLRAVRESLPSLHYGVAHV